MDIDYFDKVMAELFQRHDYRLMYEFWLEKIKPELEKNQEMISGLKEWIIGVTGCKC